MFFVHLGLFRGIDDPFCKAERETKTKEKYMDTRGRGGEVWRLGLIHMQY